MIRLAEFEDHAEARIIRVADLLQVATRDQYSISEGILSVCESKSGNTSASVSAI